MVTLDSSTFTTHVNKLMSHWRVPGLAIALIQDDTITSRGFGHATLRPDKQCTADTLFDIASSSKSLTAASVGLLCADDETYPNVQWEATMSSLLPEDFVMSDEVYTENVTVADVLSHRTGLPRHDDSYMGVRAARPDTARSVTRNLRNLEVSAPIRTKYQYNNLMYTVATYLVEKLSGLTFADFLSERFFRPLGLTSTYLQPEAAIAAGLKDRIALPYVWNEEKETYTAVELTQSPEAQGAGSIFTSVNDYIKWVRAVMDKQHPITEDVYKEITKPRMLADADSKIDDREPLTSHTLYCAGWEITHFRGHEIVQHDGMCNGFSSRHFFLPHFKFGGVLLGNSSEAGSVINILVKELIEEFLHVAPDERIDWSERQKPENDPRDLVETTSTMRKELCQHMSSDAESPQPQKLPLSLYAGEYFNPGYQSLTVQVQNDKLFIDASDRGGAFYLTFEHVCNQTMYIAHLREYYEGVQLPCKAEFRFENDRVVKMGIEFDPDQDLKDYIWFHRVEKSSTTDTAGKDEGVVVLQHV